MLILSSTISTSHTPTARPKLPPDIDLHLKGNWLAEARFETGRGVMVNISDGCIVLMTDGEEA